MAVDLHSHSTASDGTDTPGALARLAHQVGLRALALTDHDTTAGLAECAAGCAECGVDFVPGIEISCDRGAERGTLHILGYFVSAASSELRQVCDKQQAARNQRVPLILARLADADIHLSADDVQRESGGGVAIGRPHIASALLRAGVVGSITEAFERYLGYGGAAFVRKEVVSAGEAIDAIHAAGGLAALAHPIQLRCRDDDDLSRMIEGLTDRGLDGLEQFHPDHDRSWTERIGNLAGRFGLLVSGGSDYHGTRKRQPLGSIGVADQVYVSLLRKKDRRG
jgi:predicted metal-dependent phosphoesterase TrpH